MEGIDCFRNGSLRAGVIFIWSSAIKNIRKQILDIDTLKNINEELIRIDTRAKKIKNIESFEYIKDETTIHLAEKIGVSRQTINAIESGKYVPSTVLSVKIARVFEKSMEDLFSLEGTD